MEKKLSDYVLEVRNFLQDFKHKQFCYLLDKNSFSFKPAELVGNRIDKNIRDTLHVGLQSLNEPSMTNVHWANTFHYYLRRAMFNYFKVTNTILDSNMNVSDIQILKYPIGGFYKPHVDHGDKINRSLSFLYLVNENYKGGELYFFNDGKEYPVKVEKNKLIVFPSNFMYMHGVKPVTEGVKYSVVSWAL